MYKNDPMMCLTGECRLSYVNLVTPRAQNPGDPEKYSVLLLITKNDVATIADIKSAIKAAADSSVATVWGGVRPNIDFNAILHDGDGVKPQAGTAYSPECKGCWVLSATAKALAKPFVCDINNRTSELPPQDIYSGMYARCVIRFYGYKNRKVGVGCGIKGVMKTRDGEALSGTVNDASLFEDVEHGAAPTQPQVVPSINPITGQPM